MATGTVKWFNNQKGFGFIKPDDNSTSDKDIFVHKNGTREGIKENDRVTYEIEESPKGLNAVNVKITQE